MNKQEKSLYRVKYVGDDSLDHIARVMAESHDDAVAIVKRDYKADFVIGVRRSNLVRDIVVAVLIVVALVVAYLV